MSLKATLEASACEMQALIKTCNLPLIRSKLNKKNKKVADVCIVENQMLWRAAIFRLSVTSQSPN